MGLHGTSLGAPATRRVARLVLSVVLAGSAGLAYGQAPGKGQGALAPRRVEAQSSISTVTVYGDRAMVTRSATLDLVPGETTIVFSGLPAATDAASIQIGGTGAFTMRDVRVDTRQVVRDVSAIVRQLEDELRSYEEKLEAENDRVREAESEKAFLEGLARRVTAGQEGDSGPLADVASWSKLLDFYRQRQEAVSSVLRTTRKTIRSLQAEIARVRRDLSSAGSGARLSVLEAEVLVEAGKAGDTGKPVAATLQISYLVRGPSWRPDYVIRATSEDTKLSLQYRALVRQNTGESWDGVALNLSTAQPQVGGSMPSLSPWYLDVYRPQPVYKDTGSSRKMAEMPAPAAAPMMASAAADEVAEPAPEMAYAQAATSTGATSVTFSVAGATTVPSDNRDKTVTVALLPLPVEYSWAAVPRLSSHAYFRAKATNKSDYPLLAGDSHVYVDGAYVADASMELVAPDGEFTTDLGVDDAVTVERVLRHKLDETTGLVAKKSKTTWTYAIVVKNNKRVPIDLTISDQVPITANEQILVKVIEPLWTKDTETLKKLDGNMFEWRLRLQPAGGQTIPLQFSVEYPKGMVVIGLD